VVLADRNTPGLLADSIAAPLTIEPGWWQKQLSLCLALLIAAVPYLVVLTGTGLSGSPALGWGGRMAGPSRRIYLYVIIAAAIIGLAADLVNIIYQIMSNALSGNLGIAVLRDSKWSIHPLVIAAPLLAYTTGGWPGATSGEGPKRLRYGK